MTVCIYRPFGAFHWHSHSPSRENTGCCTANASLHVLYTSATQTFLCECVYLKIACTPNYCCTRCGKQVLPPPKVQTHHPTHSSLCVPVWQHRKSRLPMCVCMYIACKFAWKESEMRDSIFACVCVKERERFHVCIWVSPDHTLWSRRRSVPGFGHGHTAPPLAGWKPYTPHQSDLPLIHYS